MEQSTPLNGRRRFFRLAGLGTAAAGLGTLAFGALAHGRRGGRGGFDPADMEERLDRMLRHAYVEIDATPEQQAKIEPIVKQAAAELRPLREQARNARREGLRLFSADTIDRGAIERLRAQQIQATDAASKRFTQALTDVAEVLTPEQRRTLAERFARGRRGHGRGRG
jgi:Spy/CpxP family protein refolding chaperone